MNVSNKAIGCFSALIIMLSGLTSCQNDGYLGWLFGVWRVAEYTVDGQKQTSDLIESTTFGFQNNIVNVVQTSDGYVTENENYGTWKQDGDFFEFNFMHSDSDNQPGQGIYSPPYWLGFVSTEVMEMKIISHTDRTLTLEWVSPDGKQNIYKLEKTW